MKKLIAGMAAGLSLSLAAGASAATVPVPSLSGDFHATNPSVILTVDGVHYGPYANGGSAGGSLFYSGFNGHKLSELTSLSFTERHDSTDDSPIASPYLRIFLAGDTHDVIFDATQCASVVPGENVDNQYEVVGNSVRYDDDSCDGAANHNFPGSPAGQQTWASVLTHHGNEVISGIYLTAGFAGGADLTALVPSLTVNGTTFAFSAPHNGDPGPTGPQGNTGAPGGTGTTTAVQQPVVVSSPTRLIGNTVRTLHIPKRNRGARYVSATAFLRGKRLAVRHRTIRVDLRGRSVGLYNVRIRARYRRADRGIIVVLTTRHLSVQIAR